jgi:uncharacterized protein YqgC (DUF456 family)
VEAVTLLCGAAIVVGLIGIVLPILPGLLLVLAAVLLWTFDANTPAAWWWFAAAATVTALGMLVKYLVPGKRLREAGVPWVTLFAGGVLGLIGFFVIPVVGLPLGFVLGIYLAEYLRLHEQGPAWRSTKHALGAVGLSMLLEMLTGLVVAGIWITEVIVVG